MSKHRIKSVGLDEDYDESYDDDYEEDYGQTGQNVNGENGLTAEDREQLRIGTIQVRNDLGQSFSILTDKEIQDTLWHYYYDIAKSTAYLKGTFFCLSLDRRV